MYITYRILFTIISILLLIDNTKQSRVRFARGTLKAIKNTIKSPLFKTIGDTIKNSVRKFRQNKTTIKNFACSFQDKYLGAMHSVGSNSLKYLGERGFQKFKYISPQAIRGSKQLFRAEGRKNLQRRSSTQMRRDKFRPILFKNTKEQVEATGLRSLINMVSESKPILFATGAYIGLARKTDLPPIESMTPEQIKALIGDPSPKKAFVGGYHVTANKDLLGKEMVFFKEGEEHTHTQIWLHGQGGAPRTWIEVFEDIRTPLHKSTKVLCLTAPTAPVTCEYDMMLNSWYDVNGKISKPNFYKFNDAERSSKLVRKVIAEEIEKLGGKSKNVFIGGFQQGTAMALHVGLGYEKPLGGVVGLSGYKLKQTTTHENNKNTPVFLAHGEEDLEIPYKDALKTYEDKGWLKSCNVEIHPIEGLHHYPAVAVQEMFKAFINLHSK